MFFSKKSKPKPPTKSSITFYTDGSITVDGDHKELTIIAAHLLSGGFTGHLLMSLQDKIPSDMLNMLATKVVNSATTAQTTSDVAAIPAHKTINFFYGGNKR